MAKLRGNTLARYADAAVGIPIVALTGLLSHRCQPPVRLDSIAVISIGCIGDTLLLDGLLSDFKNQHPDCRITMFTNSTTAGIANLLAAVDIAVQIPIQNPVRAFRILRSFGKFDCCIDTGQWSRISAIYASATPTRYSVGFRTPKQFRHWCFDTRINHLSTIHEIDNFRRLFEPLGLQSDSPPSITPPSGERVPQTPYAVLHMFPSGRLSHMKEWPRERWIELAKTMAHSGMPIYFSGAMADAEKAHQIVEEVNDERVMSIAGKTSLPQLAATLKHASAVVSVNTGVMHLAAAVGAPLVTINGPTSTQRWGPLAPREKAISLIPNLSCAPCLNLGFEYGCTDNRCMRAISTDAVINAVNSITQNDVIQQ